MHIRAQLAKDGRTRRVGVAYKSGFLGPQITDCRKSSKVFARLLLIF